nr:MAG TPA: hypothetical protein [Caudoviricetes sp.]
MFYICKFLRRLKACYMLNFHFAFSLPFNLLYNYIITIIL